MDRYMRNVKCFASNLGLSICPEYSTMLRSHRHVSSPSVDPLDCVFG